MKYFAWLACLFCLGIYVPGRAQQKPEAKQFFIYIQNENGTPFYVKKGSSLMSSSPEGYIIIPQLAKGKYRFTIGFPKNEVPEASFDVNLDGSGDKGFLIRKESKSFQLLGLRNFNVVKPLAVASAPGNRIVGLPVTTKPSVTAEKDNMAKADEDKQEVQPEAAIAKKNTTANSADDSDAFSRMLNEITGKSKPAPVAASSPEKQSSSPDSQKTAIQEVSPAQADLPVEEASANEGQDSHLPADNHAVAPEEPARKERKHRSKNEPQFITFADSIQAGPVQEEVSPVDNPSANNSEPETDSAAIARREQRKLRREQRRAEKEAKRKADSLSESSTMDHTTQPGNIAGEAVEGSGNNIITANAPAEKRNPDTIQQVPIGNSDCRHLANEDDFQKVRRKMASRSSEEAMYDVAKKYFSGGTCYSTAQVKSLTYLFMTDEYKYKFLELAYAHIYDTGKFPSLVKTLGSDYYQGRFKAMVK